MGGFTLEPTFQLSLEGQVEFIGQKKFVRVFQRERTTCANSSGQDESGFLEEQQINLCKWNIMLPKQSDFLFLPLTDKPREAF